MFSDRVEAGRRLANHLLPLAGREDVVVVGLPRGGVPVAFEVAVRLRAPLDVIVVRKLGVPYRPELAMGAIGEDGVRILDRRIVDRARVTDQQLEAVEVRERAELERRTALFRQGRPRVPLTGAVAVIVDDGIATGSTVKAACRVARELGAARVVVAAPVAPDDIEGRLEDFADDVVVVERPADFGAVGQFYADFDQTGDDEVVALLQRASGRPPLPDPTGATEVGGGGSGTWMHEDVRIPLPDVTLEGRLDQPPRPRGTVVFVHGSGSSRQSPRNRYVAAGLGQAGLGTLLFDLLTPAEERDRSNVFDIELLGARLTAVTEWLAGREDLSVGSIGFFGASTGAAAALRAAAELGPRVAAVVCRGGRPDLTGEVIAHVVSPTLFIVGGDDTHVLHLNRTARGRMRCETALEIVPGAGHLFEEPGALDRVLALSSRWFLRHL
ncbi:phosphoribosyltransferase family protein [Nostocoides sp. F2B08]|uniref:phosphoribosyltransferase family protein n=1 Tax=Nostocoides sp. F2B08 TaxID=2653936 RepID=UPI001D0414CC|nr:phosphoribosyltransferase family protein [Tetrasphaera sp. F2B08]